MTRFSLIRCEYFSLIRVFEIAETGLGEALTSSKEQKWMCILLSIMHKHVLKLIFSPAMKKKTCQTGEWAGWLDGHGQWNDIIKWINDASLIVLTSIFRKLQGLIENDYKNNYYFIIKFRKVTRIRGRTEIIMVKWVVFIHEDNFSKEKILELQGNCI